MAHAGHVIVHPTADRLVLEEFRLSDGAAYADADRALAAADPTGVPLLISIGDDRDVASIRCVPARLGPPDETIDRSAFRALVSRWGPVHTYRPRVAESSLIRPTSYRLAVTESGINGTDPMGVGATSRDGGAGDGHATTLDLLWIGAPLGSHAGLLVLIGDGERAAAADVAWPLSLSGSLGVRIYRARARA